MQMTFQKIIDVVKDDPKHMRDMYRICKLNRKGEIVKINDEYAESSWPLKEIPDVIEEAVMEYNIPRDRIVVLRPQYVIVEDFIIEKPKKKQPKVDSLSKKECWDLFDYATSIAEDVSDFIDGEMTGKQLLKQTYGKETKAWLKSNFNRCGVERTRKYLSRRLKQTGTYRS